MTKNFLHVCGYSFNGEPIKYSNCKFETVSENETIGKVLESEKYKFIDSKLVAEIVKDTFFAIATIRGTNE